MEIPVTVRFPTDTSLDPGTAPETVERLGELYSDLDRLDLQPLWTQNKQLLSRVPRPKAVPWMWRRVDMIPLAARCAELITISRGGDRRVLALANPGLDGRPFITSTLWAAIQYLGAHESAPAHRHSPGAIRFVLEGEGTFTTVNGDACDMRAGDLVLTPPWHWHDHKNESDSPMTWFDGLDLPLVNHLDATFFEEYPAESMQPVRGHNLSEQIYRAPGTVPAAASSGASVYSPLLVYRFADTEQALRSLARESGAAMVSLEYVNPLSGASVMPTLGCHASRLAPGQRTATERQVGSQVFVAFRGSGTTVIDGRSFDWGPGDIFVAPSWAAVDHEASTESYLFHVTDAPVLKALGLNRHTVEHRNQDVLGKFAGHAAAL
ncbi:cupin domain-containing protein [Dactylosporangium sp. NPDC000555]|uniref:cupin domain-containing protein n=1 Tax=Dactylosporangium sp. NPDC000555 TaxID=3154260 RepID=UPI003324D59B